MKSGVVSSRVKGEDYFPHLGESEHCIVLFSSYEHGVVVKPLSDLYVIGDFRGDWNMDKFTRSAVGTQIILTQE